MTARFKFLFSLRGYWGFIVVVMLISSCRISAQVLQSNNLRIVSPAAGDVFVPGQTVTVTVQVSPTASFSQVHVIGERLLAAPIKRLPPYEFAFRLPDTFIGKKSFTAVGFLPNGEIISSYPVVINIESSMTASELVPDLKQIKFRYPGERIRVTLSATFSNGSGLDVTNSTRTRFTSGNNGVVLVDSTGALIAAGVGSTNVTVQYDSKQANISVSVPQLTRGDLTGDRRVDSDDLAEIQLWFNTLATCPNDARDLNRDGKIDALDARILTTLCTNPRCAGQ